MLLLGYDATILATSVRMDDHEVDQVCNDFKDIATPKIFLPLVTGACFFWPSTSLGFTQSKISDERRVSWWISHGIQTNKWEVPSCSENSWICFGHSLALVQSSQSMQKIAMPLMASYLHCTDSPTSDLNPKTLWSKGEFTNWCCKAEIDQNIKKTHLCMRNYEQFMSCQKFFWSFPRKFWARGWP